jgi:hypothetical protein
MDSAREYGIRVYVGFSWRADRHSDPRLRAAPDSAKTYEFRWRVWSPRKRSVYGANHESRGLPTGFRYSSSLLESARMAAEDPGQLAAAVGASRARTRLAVSCRGDFHLGTNAQPLTRGGLSNLGELVFGQIAVGVIDRCVFIISTLAAEIDGLAPSFG